MAENKRRPHALRPLPICKAILLCNDVVRDPKLHTSSVFGIFDSFLWDSFPATIEKAYVFLVLKEAIGEFVLSAEIHDLNRDLIVARSRENKIGVPGSRTSGEQWIPLNGVVIEQPGIYDVIVFADGREVDRTQFRAQTHEERADEKRRKGQA
jgi:hypothetical protein